MSIDYIRSACHFCSEVSKANGEDPIGSVRPFEHWLIIEASPPWPSALWMEPKPMPPEVIELVEAIHAQGVNFRQLAIAPDREYSRPGYARVLNYRRPARRFAQFEKQEFIVPEEQVGALAIALYQQPEQLPKFEPYRQETRDIRELMVCVHGNEDVACARFGYPIYEKLRKEYAPASGGQLRVWRVSHFGGHQFAPTLVDLPVGHCWGHLEPEALNCLVYRNEPVASLRPFYRGWAGLTRFEQIVEREIWMQEGWKWLDYHKSGQMLAIDPANEERYADWAQVRIDFAARDGSVFGAYEARVEVSGRVMTMRNSGNEQSIEEVKQYSVSRLVKVA